MFFYRHYELETYIPLFSAPMFYLLRKIQHYGERPNTCLEGELLASICSSRYHKSIRTRNDAIAIDRAHVSPRDQKTKRPIQLGKKLGGGNAVPSMNEHHYHQHGLGNSPKLSNAFIFCDLKTKLDIQVRKGTTIKTKYFHRERSTVRLCVRRAIVNQDKKRLRRYRTCPGFYVIKTKPNIQHRQEIRRGNEAPSLEGHYCV